MLTAMIRSSSAAGSGTTIITTTTTTANAASEVAVLEQRLQDPVHALTPSVSAGGRGVAGEATADGAVHAPRR